MLEKVGQKSVREEVAAPIPAKSQIDVVELIKWADVAGNRHSLVSDFAIYSSVV